MAAPGVKLIVGCGYLGQRVVAQWQVQGATVAALTRSPERAERFRAQGLLPVVGDVMEPRSLKALPDADTVLYAVGFDRASGWSQGEVYVDGLRNVLAELSGRVRRWLHVSSTSVYGESAGEWVDESSPCAPSRPNGQVCLEAERAMWQFFPPDAPADAPHANVLRLAGLYGPGRLLQRIEALRAGAAIEGDPDAWLNLIHVDDAAAAVLACEQRGGPGEVYLVCDDRPVRRREHYAALAALVNAPPPRFSGTSTAAPRTGGLNKRCSNRKVREELGLELAFPSIREGLPHAVGEAK